MFRRSGVDGEVTLSASHLLVQGMGCPSPRACLPSVSDRGVGRGGCSEGLGSLRQIIVEDGVVVSSSINISDLSPSVCMRWRPSCVRSHTLEDRCTGPQGQAQVRQLVSRSAMLDLTDAGRRLAEALLPHAESRGSVDKTIAIIWVLLEGGEGCGGTSHINIFNLP